jgi:hypothetical protein
VTRSALVRVTLAIVWVAIVLVLANACYSGLGSLAAFPCALDGTCPNGFDCNAGKQCVPSQQCDTGDVSCGGSCVDVSTDSSNCGQCGVTCAATQSCCNYVCVEVSSDSENCGSCGNKCLGGAKGQTCLNSVCTCMTGETLCSSAGGCIDTATNENNCGACQKVCSTNEGCTGGKCTCMAPYTSCPSGSGSVCTNTSSDSSHCGSCGTVCSGGRQCGGSPPSCQCPTGTTYCPGTETCASFSTDPLNCGGCGTVCASNVCQNGTCCVLPTKGSACSPSPLCGCAGTQNCEYESSGIWACFSAGATPPGGACTGTAACTAGNSCFQSACAPYCSCASGETSCTDSSCPSGACEQTYLVTDAGQVLAPGWFSCVAK